MRLNSIYHGQVRDVSAWYQINLHRSFREVKLDATLRRKLLSDIMERGITL